VLSLGDGFLELTGVDQARLVLIDFFKDASKFGNLSRVRHFHEQVECSSLQLADALELLKASENVNVDADLVIFV